MKKRHIKILSTISVIVLLCCFLFTACISKIEKPDAGNNNNSNKVSNKDYHYVVDYPTESEKSEENEIDIVIPDDGIDIVLPDNATVNTVTYTYAAIAVDLMTYGYDVFNAYVETEEGKDYGIAYTDYKDGYQYDDDEKLYIASGFFGFSADESVSASSEALFATPLDENAQEISDENYGYIISCVEDGIPAGHFIADNLYTVYAVSNGKVDIETYENTRENYDLSLGTLYDYDKQDVVYVPYDEIDSSPVEYVPLTEDIDYEGIKNSLYEIVADQELKGYSVQSVTISFLSVDTLNSLRGMLAQQDSLNGYLFEELDSIEYNNMNQYIVFNDDGSITVKDLPPIPVTKSKSIIDWIVDALVIAGTASLALVSFTFLGPAGGCIAAGFVGAGIEYFTQTVIGGKSFSEVNWTKVGITAVAGIIRATIPCAGTLGYLAAGVVGGFASAACAAVDGGDTDEILCSALWGATSSMVVQGLFSSCFPAGTEILTDKGYIPIEAVSVGVSVASYNHFSNEIEWKSVLNTYTSFAEEVIEIELENGDIVTSTENHPYYVINKKAYVEAGCLESGDMILTADGYIKVVSVEKTALDSPIVVYNFNVDGNHNYFVDENALLVHNTCNNYYKASRAKDGIKLGSAISKKQALERLRNGQDVYSSSRKAAKALVKDAFGNSKAYSEIHSYLNGAKWHFHDAVNHIFHVYFD